MPGGLFFIQGSFQLAHPGQDGGGLLPCQKSLGLGAVKDPGGHCGLPVLLGPVADGLGLQGGGPAGQGLGQHGVKGALFHMLLLFLLQQGRHVGPEGVHTLAVLGEPVHDICVVAGDVQLTALMVVHDVGGRIKGELSAQLCGQFHRVLVDGGEIGGICLRVIADHGTALVGVALGLQDLEGDVGVVGGQSAVSGTSGVPGPVVPGQGLDHAPLMDQGVDAGVRPGLSPELQKDGRVGLGHAGGVDHDALGDDGPARLVAVALGENVLGEFHRKPPRACGAQIRGEGQKASPHFYAGKGLLLYVLGSPLAIFFRL